MDSRLCVSENGIVWLEMFLREQKVIFGKMESLAKDSKIPVFCTQKHLG